MSFNLTKADTEVTGLQVMMCQTACFLESPGVRHVSYLVVSYFRVDSQHLLPQIGHRRLTGLIYLGHNASISTVITRLGH